MKILLAHKFFNTTGGAEFFFHETGRVLEKNGHTVKYFATDNPTSSSQKKNSDNVYWAHHVSYLDGNIINKVKNFPEIVYSRKNKNLFKKILDDFKPDIVHAFAIFTTISPSILEACKEKNIPVIMSCNDYKHICPNYKLFHHGHICQDCKTNKFYMAVINNCCKNSIKFSTASAIESYVHHSKDICRKNITRFLFASEFMAHKTEEFWGKDSFNWSILKNPFNSPDTEASIVSKDYILFFGRFVEEKGINILLKAMKLIPDVKLLLVGDGPEEENYKKLAKNLQLKNIEFIGPKWGEEIEMLISHSKFVVVPSIWHENFPYVILQAFSHGKAVIGSDRGGIPELINDGNFGDIYPALNHQELADKINTLWNNQDKAVKMGLEAKKWADQEFNDEAFYKNIMQIYKEVLN